MYKQTLPLFLCIFLSACDLIDYHPYDGRLTISERDINDHNIPLIEAATKDKDTIRFVLMGDTQRSYDETEDFVKHINTKKDSIDFIIHGGDYTEFGMKKEYIGSGRHCFGGLSTASPGLWASTTPLEHGYGKRTSGKASACPSRKSWAPTG